MTKLVSNQLKPVISAFNQNVKEIGVLQKQVNHATATINQKHTVQPQLSDQEYDEALKTYNDTDMSVFEGVATEAIAAETTLKESIRLAKTIEELGIVYVEEVLREDLDPNPHHKILQSEINIRKEQKKNNAFLENIKEVLVQDIESSFKNLEQNPLYEDMNNNQIDMGVHGLEADVSALKTLVTQKISLN